MNKKTIITLISISIFTSGCANQQTKKSNIETVKENKQIEQHIEENDNKNSMDIVKESNVKDRKIKEVFWGQWVIKKQLAYGVVGTFDDEDIKKIIGKKLSFSKEKASCFGDNISYLNDLAKNPVYKKSNLSKGDFELDNRITFEKLAIKGDYITEVTVNDSQDRGCVFYIKDNTTLILYGGGVYFQLNRA